MNLDKRVKPGYRPLTCFDTEEALKYIGKPCYFTSEIGRFNVLNKYCDYGILEEVLDPALEPFQMAGEDDETYQFIIPEEWCK